MVQLKCKLQHTLKSWSYASDMGGKRGPKRSSFGPTRGFLPASPGMLMWSIQQFVIIDDMRYNETTFTFIT